MTLFFACLAFVATKGFGQCGGEEARGFGIKVPAAVRELSYKCHNTVRFLPLSTIKYREKHACFRWNPDISNRSEREEVENSSSITASCKNK